MCAVHNGQEGNYKSMLGQQAGLTAAGVGGYDHSPGEDSQHGHNFEDISQKLCGKLMRISNSNYIPELLLSSVFKDCRVLNFGSWMWGKVKVWRGRRTASLQPAAPSGTDLKKINCFLSITFI